MKGADNLATRERKNVCGAKSGHRSGACQQPAGWGTEHNGEGRCKFHGGNNIVKHGIYSAIKRNSLRELIEKHGQNPDPMDMLAELATMRALFEDFVNRKVRSALDVDTAGRIVAEITKIVERIERIRAANAISRPDLNRVMQEMWRSVDGRVTDAAVKAAIREDWLRVRL